MSETNVMAINLTAVEILQKSGEHQSYHNSSSGDNDFHHKMSWQSLQ